MPTSKENPQRGIRLPYAVHANFLSPDKKIGAFYY